MVGNARRRCKREATRGSRAASAPPESLRNRHLEKGSSRRQVPGAAFLAAYFHLHVHSEVAPRWLASIYTLHRELFIHARARSLLVIASYPRTLQACCSIAWCHTPLVNDQIRPGAWGLCQEKITFECILVIIGSATSLSRIARTITWPQHGDLRLDGDDGGAAVVAAQARVQRVGALPSG